MAAFWKGFWEVLKTLPTVFIVGILIAILVTVIAESAFLSFEVHEGRQINLGPLHMDAKEDPKVTNCKQVAGKLSTVEEKLSILTKNDQFELAALEDKLKDLQNQRISYYPRDPQTSINVIEPQIVQTRKDIDAYIGTLSGKVKNLTEQVNTVKESCP